MAWLLGSPVPRVQCDRCGRSTYSRYDRRLALPERWVRLNDQDVCGACIRQLLGRPRLFVQKPSCFACGQTILPAQTTKCPRTD
jgi:hypothetical protein